MTDSSAVAMRGIHIIPYGEVMHSM